MDSKGFDLAIADMPGANRLILHVLAAAAEHERHMIGERTRHALAAAKARGIKIGNPKPGGFLARENFLPAVHRNLRPLKLKAPPRSDAPGGPQTIVYGPSFGLIAYWSIRQTNIAARGMRRK